MSAENGGSYGTQVADAAARAVGVIVKLSSKDFPLGGERMPQAELSNCAGLAFTFIKKAGAVVTLDSGKGFVLAKCKGPDGNLTWSAPLFITTFSAGLGLTLGFSQIDSVIVLDTPEAVGRYAQSQTDFGTDMTAVGPLGKVAGHIAEKDFELGKECISYSVASGALVDYSIKGMKYSLDTAMNMAYGNATPKDVLDGKVATPDPFKAVHAALDQYMQSPKATH